MNGIYIKSDFKDYYDYLHSECSNVVYNRFLSDSKQRGTALKYLRNLGIKTLDVKPVKQYYRDDGPIVVYTSPNLHHSSGKKIMDVEEAMQYYSNCIASKYIQSDKSIKFLQIGKRRFTLFFNKKDLDLNLGELINITESQSSYNRIIGLPIFSIDYISDSESKLVATDFNEVEDLKRLGIDKIISAEDIVREIREALIVYNKI